MFALSLPRPPCFGPFGSGFVPVFITNKGNGFHSIAAYRRGGGKSGSATLTGPVGIASYSLGAGASADEDGRSEGGCAPTTPGIRIRATPTRIGSSLRRNGVMAFSALCCARGARFAWPPNPALQQLANRLHLSNDLRRSRTSWHRL